MHVPVLLQEVVKELDPQPNQNFIDATFGEGGHSLAILEKTGPKGRVLGIDWNPETLKKTGDRLVLVNDNFANLKEIVDRTKFPKVSGILLDLGLSSGELEESGRGFSFQKKEPLDMRYNLANPLTAERIVNYWSYQDLERILREYGEEQFSREIARKFIEARSIRPIKITSQLVEIVGQATPRWYQGKRIHFATKTFQALRITVNGELDNLSSVLPKALEVLEKGGRLAVISFHSLEDRIVKNFFKQSSWQILTKKPIIPSVQELKINPRARSAKLRVARKI